MKTCSVAFAILVTFWMSSFLVFLLELLLTWIKPDLPSKNIFNYEKPEKPLVSEDEVTELRMELQRLKMESSVCVCKHSYFK